MKSNHKRYKKVLIGVPAPLLQLLDVHAEQANCTRSELIRLLIRNHCNGGPTLMAGDAGVSLVLSAPSVSRG
jgi:metal-responsive CopG/Arc/MetJ family transcriptional regulator